MNTEQRIQAFLSRYAHKNCPANVYIPKKRTWLRELLKRKPKKQFPDIGKPKLKTIYPD